MRLGKKPNPGWACIFLTFYGALGLLLFWQLFSLTFGIHDQISLQFENLTRPLPLNILLNCSEYKQGWNYVEEEGGCGPPPNFFKILNNSYIFKILENKFMKNYICPSQENYICPPRLRILVLSLNINKTYFYVFC